MQFIVKEPSAAGLDAVNKDKYLASLDAFWLMKACHVFMFVALICAMLLKRKEFDNASTLIVVLATPVYILAVLSLVFTFKMQGGTEFMLNT